MTTIEKPFKVLYKTAHDEHIVEEFDTAADALDYGLAYYSHLSSGDRETVTIIVAEVTEAYEETGDIDSIIWNSDEQTVPDERMPQYMIDKGLMPWEEDEIHEAVRETGARYDDDAELTLREAMEDLLEGDKWVRACDHARRMAQEFATTFYDEGWRASASPKALDELVIEYKLTPLEIKEIVDALEKIEEEQDEKGWNENDLEMIAVNIIEGCTDGAEQARWDWMDDHIEAHRVEDGLTDKQLKTVRRLVTKGLEEVDAQWKAKAEEYDEMGGDEE